MCLITLLASPSPADEERDFVSLFDGKTLNGWRTYQQDQATDDWTVDEGAIHGSGQGGDLITKAQFGDFELKFEWKIAPGGNSGVIYRVSEDQKQSYQTGPEYQILDESLRDEDDPPVPPTVATGALYGLYGASEKPFQSSGEFNTGRIVARGDHIEHWLNGTKIVDCEMQSDDWKKKVAASKFHAWPGFAKNAQGHIALQSHNHPVWFRNLRIKKLTPEEEP
jgi:hypothetical protein